MKRFIIWLALAVFPLTFGFLTNAVAQDNEVRPSLKASVMQRIGVDTDITIVYSRPGVKGRKIWGGLEPFNKVWRAGANENTTFEVSKDVLVNGQRLPAGKYGLHMIPGEKEWTVIFSKNNSAWGSFSYKEEEDALRVIAMPKEAPHQEWLMYGFENLGGTTATCYLWWEKLKVLMELKTTD
jgi:Protein of unknown function (DUF2911)